jgi:hypothetical protein
MSLDLSSLKFTNQADLIPASGTTEIINAALVNTLGGDDIITGYGETLRNILFYGSLNVGIYNGSGGVINTGDGSDNIAGYGGVGLFNDLNATISTGTGNDTVSGCGCDYGDDFKGILNSGTINTGSGGDTVIGNANGNYSGGIVNGGTINTEDGNDSVFGSGAAGGINNIGLSDGKGGLIDTGNGNDDIFGESDRDWGIYNGYLGAINTGNGDDSIVGITTGGDDAGILNYELATINTGSGDDTIIGTGKRGIWNDGTIDTGNGNDLVNALNGGFSGKGKILLGEDNDVIVGFGSGNFNGGSGIDMLELVAGKYTIGISGSAVSFTSNNVVMNTSEFEKLIAGSSMSDFSSFTNGQTITVS